MKLITEISEEVQYITEAATESSPKKMYIEGIFLQADLKNKNGRVYPMSVMESEVNRYITDKVDNKTAYGELGHPAGPTINPDRISHRIISLKKEGNNFIGKAQLASEGLGKLARGLIEDGGRLGVSSRGMGSLKEKNGIMEVQGDFHLATAGDIVIDPSAPDAFVNGIMENVEWIYDNKYGWKAIELAETFKKEIHTNYKRLTESEKLIMFNRFVKNL